MANFDEMLNSAAAQSSGAMIPEVTADAEWTPPTLFKQAQVMDNQRLKQAMVTERAAEKQKNMLTPAQFYNNAIGAETGLGSDTLTPVESDLRNLSPLETLQKYGKEQGSQLIMGQARGEKEVLQDQTRNSRDGTEYWDDANVNFGSGLGAVLGGVGALGLGLVNKDAGTAAAGLVGDFTKFMDEEQSNKLQSRKRLQEAKQFLSERDNAAQEVKDTATDGSTVAGFKRVGRDIVSTLGTATDDSATLGSGIINALGSMVGVGPVAKGLSAASKGVLGTTAAIAATESGGSYIGSAQDIMGRSHEQLDAESPVYRHLIETGRTPEEAKTMLANDTGLLAAAITAPVAAVAGRLVHKFEANPLSLGAGRQALGNIGRETVEETIQSGFGQYAQNVADRTLADETASLTKGVGRATAEGGLYGLGMSTALAIPGVTKSAAGKVVDSMAGRLDALTAKNNKASPVSDEKVATAAAQMQESAPMADEVLRSAVMENVAPEAQEEANTYVDTLLNGSNYTAEEAPAAFKEQLGDVTNRVGAIQRMAEIVKSTEEGSNDQLRAGFYLNSLVGDYAALINSDPEAMSAIPADHQANGILNQYKDLMGAITSSPKVMSAINTIQDMIEKSEAKKATVDAQTLTTPEGQQDVADVIGVAELAPEKVDLGTAEQVLYQIAQGNLNVTPRQKAALDTSVALLRAVQAADVIAVANGQADPVSLNISSVSGEKGPSLTQHAKGIMAAWKSGDRNLASDRLTDLATFAEGMANKLDALNAHFAAGNPDADGLTYGITVGGQPQVSKSKVAVRSYNPESVAFAQKVAAEAKLLGDVYNNLVDAFPDLAGEHLVIPTLSAELVGPANEVASRYTKPVKSKSTPVKVKAKPVTAPVDSAPAPKAEPVEADESSVRTSLEATKKLPYLDRIKAVDSILNEENTSDLVEGSAALTDLSSDLLNDDKGFTDAFETVRSGVSRMISEDLLNRMNKRFDDLVSVPVTERDSGHTQEQVNFLEWLGKLAAAQESKQGNLLDTPAKAEKKAEPTPVEEVTEAEPVAKGIAAAFPQLLATVPNFFIEAFKLPTEQRTRTIGTEAPIDTIQRALSDSASLTAFLGSPLVGEYTPEIASAYKRYINQGKNILGELDDNLQEFLSEENLLDRVLNGEEVNRFIVGKALNIVEQDDGTLVYNKELIETAVLASLQWFLNSEQYGSTQDAKAIADSFGMQESNVRPELVYALNQGMSYTEATRTLATKIKSYWGVQNNPSAARGYTDGIPEAVAKEILRSLVKRGWLNAVEVRITEADGLPALPNGKPNVQTPIQLIPYSEEGSPLHADSALSDMTDVIEKAVLLEPEEQDYIGEGAIPTGSTTQLRNPDVKITAQQQEMQAKEQATPYFVNPTMSRLYTALGVDSVLKLFRAEKGDKTVMNKNHAMSQEGVSRATAAAHNHFQKLLGKIANIGDVTTTPVRFGVEFSRVGRMQMSGRYNPQANKLVREALLATQSTLDLTDTNGEGYGQYALGIAQLLGIKVHNMRPATSTAKLNDKLALLAPALNELQSWLKANNEGILSASSVEILQKAFDAAGVASNPMTLHAVLDYARYLNADAAERAAFKTQVYVEADGKTNGPVNAMMLFTTGQFTASQLLNLEKGGLYINQLAMNSGVYAEEAKGNQVGDLYEATSKALKSFIEANRMTYAGDAKITAQFNHLFFMMDEFLGGDLEFNPITNELTLQRGIAKNPLTITIYGSGAAGIAAKMTKTVMDAIYERMSQVAQGQVDGLSIAEAMFGPQSTSLADAQAKMAKFSNALVGMTNNQARMVEDKLILKFKKVKQRTEIDPVEFTFTKDEIENMQSNMLHMFVTPLRDAIQEVVGAELLSTADLLRRATQVQSIYLEYAFKKEVAAALAEKAKDPSWKKTDYLSSKEEAAIKKKLEHMSPFIETGTQNFYVAGSETTDIDVAGFSRALDGTNRTAAYINGPMDAKVSGIPFLNIGAGDGQAMQNMSVDPNGPTGTTKIFDGVNMPLDQMYDGSVSANKAVFDSWQGNPLAAVTKTFSNFMSDANIVDMDAKQQLAVSKALFGLASETEPVETIVDELQAVLSQLEESTLQIAARHEVMNKVPQAVDQMAAAARPYVHEGTMTLEGTTPEELAAEMTVEYFKVLDRMRGEQTSRDVNADFYEQGVADESGATVLNGADLSQIGQYMPSTQRDVMDVIVKSLAAQEYTVVLGSLEEIAAYNKAKGLNNIASLPQGDVKGFTVPGTKTIYLIDPSTETMVHELVHAATFEAVAAHYEGTAKNDAVPRIEAMMEQFKAQAAELTQTSETLNNAYTSTLSAINAHEAKGNKAAALNEYMAWVLANESLARIAQRTQVSKFAKVKAKLVDAIKSLLGIKSPGTDVFSNLLFNSSILMYSQATMSERFSASVLFQNSNYGNNDRLTQINQALEKTIGRYLNAAPVAGKNESSAVVSKATQNAIRVGNSFQHHGFNMNMQESSTFQTIVAALATEAAIDPNSMAAVQQLYAHVMKNLTVDSFTTDPTDTYYAAQKMDVLSGKFLVTKDMQGRSSLLPAFLALATVSEEFRAVLAKIEMPKSAKNTAGTLDAVLENFAVGSMDKLADRMSGLNGKSPSVQDAIDVLNERMAEIINDRETYIDQVASKAHGLLDRSNEIVKSGMEKLASGLLKASKRSARNGASRLERTVTGIGAGFAALIDNTAAAGVSQATMAAINKTEMWDSVHTLINDLVGRTESNANVYDMIKQVRSVVQRTRQQYRENLPETLKAKFTRPLTTEENSALHLGLGRTDLAALGSQALDLVSDQTKLTAAIAQMEKEPGVTPAHITKAKELARYMVTGKVSANLLRNAEAVSRLLGMGHTGKPLTDVANLDKLISAYALDMLEAGTKETLSSLAQEETAGMTFTLAYLTGQRAEENRKSTGMAKMNAFKGYTPSSMVSGTSMIVAHDSQYDALLKKSYVRVADYAGSALEAGQKRGYYFIPVSSRGAFEQGIMQNIVQTAGGVNASSGLQIGQTAGAITEAASVKLHARRMLRDNGKEVLMPVYNEAGQVVAFERSLDSEIMERVYGEQDLHKNIGVWRGRQVEEGFSQTFNETLVDRLKDMYDKDLSESPANAAQYVDVLTTKDAVLGDAAQLMGEDIRAYITNTFGQKFMVRRDMLNDAFGYRTASIGDLWTGTTRWSPETQKTVRDLAVSFMGNDAYKMLMTFERVVQQAVSDAKVLIVVKSVIVPAVNMISNVFQLAARGVPLATIAKSAPRKLAEVEGYTRSLVRKIEAEAELRAAKGDQRLERKLKTEIQAIDDSHRRLSIWPLLEAGEFTGISDAGLTRAEIQLTSGRLHAYMEGLVNKLPGTARNFGRYALVTKDTALFQGLQKSVEYGDFIAKAVLYEDLTQRKGMAPAAAIARITEEFVNYDRLSGRFRSSMEGMGLLWFYNFKIRSTKVALSMIRNNPVHTLLASLTPAPTLFGTMGLPTEDNLVTKFLEGTLGNSMGPGQGLHSMTLNPWINLTQ